MPEVSVEFDEMVASYWEHECMLRWEHLSRGERAYVASCLPSEILDWEMVSGYYIRTHNQVVYVEPQEIH